MVSIAFSEKYFESLLKLTPNEQSQANKAVMLFQQDPQHGGLHYEKLTAFKITNCAPFEPTRRCGLFWRLRKRKICI